jgi:hypothetical protein
MMAGGVMSGCRGGVDSCDIGSDTIGLATTAAAVEVALISNATATFVHRRG